MSLLRCPGCRQEMVPERYASTYGQPVDIDVCHQCNAFWFDGRESLMLGPAATLELFESMSRRRAQATAPRGEARACPRCQVGLQRKHGLVGRTHYHFDECPTCQGRFMTFVHFLKEKRLVREPTAREFNELRQRLRTVKCSDCGADVELAAASACASCQSPLGLLARDEVEKLTKRVKDKAGRRVPDAAELAAELARIKQQVKAEAHREMIRGAVGGYGGGDLVFAGLRSFLGV